MFLGGFGAAVIDWNQFNDILFVKGRCLIKYFYIFTRLVFVSKVISSIAEIMQQSLCLLCLSFIFRFRSSRQDVFYNCAQPLQC